MAKKKKIVECKVGRVRLIETRRYLAAWTQGPVYEKGTIVPVIPATNLPNSEGKFWIDTPELRNDAYGMLLEPGDYEFVLADK